MKILNTKDLQNFNDTTYISIGFFDGFHCGHVDIIKTLVNKANSNNSKSLVISFDDSVLKLFKMADSICTIKDKIHVLEKLHVDYLLLLSTSDGFENLSANEFKKMYLDKLHCQGIVCGTDFSFAKRKEGNIEYIKEKTSYSIDVVDDVVVADKKISSTLIRNLLQEGKIDEANKLLFTPFNVTSKVIDGKRIGRTLGFKTANLQILPQMSLLKDGVYYGRVIIHEKEYKCMINVGNNPTVSSDMNLKVEVHIVDFKDSIYNDTITVYFDKYVREEIKFNNIEELKQQLSIDYHNLIFKK